MAESVKASKYEHGKDNLCEYRFLAKRKANLQKSNKNPTDFVGQSEPGTARTNVL
ncbi:hypothetical protein ACN23B_30430 (plasmid) [Anabaena sp. FACHB-709]|uniref:Uncharacterized protein n=2 Tax=Nostocaceae TaxID=1162 RepID=A0A1Z4KWU2_ANAVA|nr:MULTISPECIES: hypothetical protein [Nostocaceae]BAY73500.1 hypothetical protein NIES23_63520 [Trichormus variabilis NIES-23]MBD2174575.1 hypothetical protein [Anabaena cylindrica FACHB-318]MBD2266374.1 hypothetical protein [Anabaena sp. FACHB-709]MBD2275748.1 hypothetical protein [Nostoc sp. PCC 7120 = FACHB-418]MBD2287182.1 hypothetical protein [Anabaena cylindrica FACHB-170]